MLLLFVVALACQLMANLLCSCEEHHRADMHICCSCSEHLTDCSNHDQSFNQSCCQLHSIGNILGSLVDVTVGKSGRLSQDLNFEFYLVLRDPLRYFAHLPSLVPPVEQGCYIFSSTEWTPLSYSLKAPPTLV